MLVRGDRMKKLMMMCVVILILIGCAQKPAEAIEDQVSLEVTQRPIVLNYGDEAPNPMELLVTGRFDSIDLPTIDTKTIGTQIAKFTAYLGNHKISKEKEIEVIDENPPVFSVEKQDIIIDLNESFGPENIPATDPIDGSVTVTIEGNVDSTKVGVYPIVAKAVDNNGLETTKKYYVAVGRDLKPVDRLSETYIALTFDDGPSRFTLPILDALKKAGGHATFFTIGTSVLRHPDVVKRAFEEGHEIGNHSLTHADFKTLSKEELMHEINETDRIIEEVTGKKPRLVRPPYGSQNDEVLNTLKELGKPSIYWSIDTRDWASRNSAAVTKELYRFNTKGQIVLMHDVYGTTVDAAVSYIEAMSAKGAKFVTVPQMFEKYGIELEPGVTYFSIK